MADVDASNPNKLPLYATAPIGANEFAFYATRSHNPLSTNALLAFGVRLKGVQHALVDLTGAAANGSKARLYLERVPVFPPDDMRLVGDIDQRTNTGDEI